MNRNNYFLFVWLLIVSVRLDAMELIVAAKGGNINKVKQAIKPGVNLDFQNKKGRTALSFAAEENHADVVQYLLEQGANPSIPDKQNKKRVGKL